MANKIWHVGRERRPPGIIAGAMKIKAIRGETVKIVAANRGIKLVRFGRACYVIIKYTLRTEFGPKSIKHTQKHKCS